ncbi:MAG TPA: DedA family protein [Alphaproteobacteria bacterium]|mgnify:CR=1 FL=1|nr:DedA family protein [Alphaproteobacteria bacterium]
MMGFDPGAIIKSFGYAGIFTAVFLENGFILFFWLPGDSLLFSVGLLASQGLLNIWIASVGIFLFAVLGYVAGYWQGDRAGLKIRTKGKHLGLKTHHMEKTQEFFKKYGNWTMIIARFLPIRPFVCYLCGASGMDKRWFMLFNIIGSALWSTSIILFGYFFGKLIPEDHIDLLIWPILACIIVVACAPIVYKYYFKRKDFF